MNKMNSLTALLVFLFSASTFTHTDAYHAHNPTGNVTIKWDVLSWTPDGYVAVVTLYNYQPHHSIEAPGWRLSWTWAKREVIWNILGSKTTEQGDCSRFVGNKPDCCQKRLTVVDSLPGTPYNQQIGNCCKGGELKPWQASAFQLVVGAAGTTNGTVKLPQNFSLQAPGPGYTCDPAKIVRPTKFVTPDGRRFTQAYMTWNATCRSHLTCSFRLCKILA